MNIIEKIDLSDFSDPYLGAEKKIAKRIAKVQKDLLKVLPYTKRLLAAKKNKSFGNHENKLNDHVKIIQKEILEITSEVERAIKIKGKYLLDVSLTENSYTLDEYDKHLSDFLTQDNPET